MKTVVISHNNNPEYAFFEPIVKFAWERLGWNVLTMVTDSVITSQCIRLYAHTCVKPDTMLMTSDIDMLPLSDYWKPKNEDITCYGRNLSREHQPICYIAMTAKNWAHVMGNDMKADISHFGESWTTDQDIVTAKLSGFKRTEIIRPICQRTGYPSGRIDRSAWDRSLMKTERIDAHLLRPGWTPENWTKIMDLITECLHPTIEELHALHQHQRTWKKLHS